MNFVVTIPLFLFASIGFGAVYALLFLLLHKIKVIKVSFLPLFLFSAILYCLITFLVGYFYIANNQAILL